MTLYPLRPLVDALGGGAINQFVLDYERQAGRRVRVRKLRVSEPDADRMATFFGHHLWEIWPETAANERQCARESCTAMFARQGKRRYCSTRCQAAEYQRLRRARDPEYAQRHRDASRRYEAANRASVNRTKAAWARSSRRAKRRETHP